MARTFVDTNLLVYSFDESEPVKREIAHQRILRLWTDGEFVISTQVLQEFYAVVTRKFSSTVAPEDATLAAERLSSGQVVLLDVQLVLDSMRRAQRHQISFWDALILGAAIKAGCEVVLTEDLQHGWKVEGLRIENPFLERQP